MQTYASERVAKDLRTRLAAKLATQTYSFVEQITPAKLLTNLTSDVDGVKLFVSMAIATIISSIFLIIGSSVLLLSINWRLGLSVLVIVPVIGIVFYLALKEVRELFKKGQEAIDWLNRVINESILGATLIRLLNSQEVEYQKFVSAQCRGEERRAQHPEHHVRTDSRDHTRRQRGHGGHPVGGRPLRDRREDDAGRFLGL